MKTTKREHTFKGFASTDNGENLNSFDPELQIKDSTIKSKLIELLTQLKPHSHLRKKKFLFAVMKAL